MINQPIDIETDDATSAAMQLDAEVVNRLRDSTILITGGTGFLGSWIVDTLRALNRIKSTKISMFITTRNAKSLGKVYPDWFDDEYIEFLQLDLAEQVTWKLSHADFIIHGATDVAKVAANGVNFALNTISGTRAVIDFASRCKTINLLYMSSGAVSPNIDGNILTAEVDDPPASLNELSNYANSKRFSEYLLNLSAKENNHKTIIARGFSFIGPRMPLEKFAIGNFILDANNGRTPELTSNGTAVRSFLYSSDAAVWYITMLAKGTGTYNVGSNDVKTLLEHSQAVSRVAGLPPPPTRTCSTTIQGVHYAPIVKRATTELNLRVFTSLDDAIRRTCSWVSLRQATFAKNNSATQQNFSTQT